MDFEFIDETDVQSVKRGRKTTVPSELVEMLTKLPKGKVALLRQYALDPTAEDYKTQKASKSAMLRKAGELAGFDVSIVWSPQGVPQVKRSTAKTAKK